MIAFIDQLLWVISFIHISQFINSFLASGDFCHLPIIFANSLDPDQDRHKVGPDLNKNVWHSDSVTERVYGKVNFEKSQQMTTKA